MSDSEELKAEIKRLSAKALKLKMDLHDLSEELPVNWQSTQELGKAVFDAFAQLEAKRAELKQAEAARG